MIRVEHLIKTFVEHKAIDDFSFFFFSSRRRHTISLRDWSSDVCSSDLPLESGARREGEQLLQRLATGEAVAAVTTRSLPALPDSPTLHFDAARPPRALRSMSWKQRAWAGAAAAAVRSEEHTSE